MHQSVFPVNCHRPGQLVGGSEKRLCRISFPQIYKVAENGGRAVPLIVSGARIPPVLESASVAVGTTFW